MLRERLFAQAYQFFYHQEFPQLKCIPLPKPL